MTIYVEFQEELIQWLSRLKKSNPQKLLRLVRLCKQNMNRPSDSHKWANVLRKQGVRLPKAERHWWDRGFNFPILILEQIKEEDMTILNLLGLHFCDYHAPYGLNKWVAKRGSGNNFLRTAYAAQPRALKEGDILLTGERVLCPPREGGNGRVLVKVSGCEGGTWLDFPGRTAIALLPSFENVPPDLIE